MIYAIVLSLIVGVLSFYYFCLKNLNVFKKCEIPHIRPLPLFGNMAPTIFRRTPVACVVQRWYEIHPDAKYVGIYDFKRPVILLRDLDLIKSIALKNFDTFPDRVGFDDIKSDPLFGKNLFALHGNRWREVRSILSPAFTSSKMKSMFILMSDCSSDFVNSLLQLLSEQKVIDTKEIFTRYTTDVIATCAFGIKVDSMKYPKNDFYIYGKEATNFDTISFLLKFLIFKASPWLTRIFKIRIIREEIATFFHDTIETTIKTRDTNNIIRPDMLQLMMDCRNKDEKTELSISDMVSQAFIFFFGGFESTSTLMCFAAHEIAVNPDVQQRLQNEIDSVLEYTNGQPSYEAINNLEYLDAVINEALRMYPVVVAVDRKCIKDFELPPTLPGGKPYTIKKGGNIAIPIYGLQHDPKYFKEPEKFDPERFLGERKKESINCGAYIPFGLGPRICIGNRFALLETKVLFFHLLACCDLKPCEKTQIPMRMTKGSFNLKPEGGFWLSMEPRKNPHQSVADNVINGNTTVKKNW